MNAPMGEVVKRLLSNEKTARIFTAQMVYALSKGLTPVVKIDGKKYYLRRTTSLSAK